MPASRQLDLGTRGEKIFQPTKDDDGFCTVQGLVHRSAKAFHGPGEAKPCLGATANTLLVTQGAEQLLHQHSQTQWDGRGTLGPGTPRLRV